MQNKEEPFSPISNLIFIALRNIPESFLVFQVFHQYIKIALLSALTFFIMCMIYTNLIFVFPKLSILLNAIGMTAYTKSVAGPSLCPGTIWKIQQL